MLKKYCKAYYLNDLRAFSDWTEKSEAGESELSGDDVVYLWNDFTVVRNPVVPDKGLVFDMITSAWQNFCTTALQFEPPGNIQYASNLHEQRTSEATGQEQNTASI